MISTSLVSTSLSYELKGEHLLTHTATTINKQLVTQSVTTHARTGEVVENVDIIFPFSFRIDWLLLMIRP